MWRSLPLASWRRKQQNKKAKRRRNLYFLSSGHIGPFANFDSGGLSARLAMYTNNAICYAAGTISRRREVRADALQNRVKMPKYASHVSWGGCRKKEKARWVWYCEETIRRCSRQRRLYRLAVFAPVLSISRLDLFFQLCHNPLVMCECCTLRWMSWRSS